MPDLDGARTALDRHDWQTARAALAGAATVDELDMFATAAWWLDDGPAVFAARERLFRLLREAGDARRAARVAIQLAWDASFFLDDMAGARGWARRARRLLNGLDAEHDRAALLVCEAAFTDDDFEILIAEARDLARRVGAFDCEMAAIALEGVGLVADGGVGEGMKLLDEAATAACAGELTDPVAITLACCGVLDACAQVSDYERATRWCDRFAALCERENMGSLIAIGRCLYAPILVGRGRLDEAERLLRESMRRLDGVYPWPDGKAVVCLADVHARRGRFEDARALLEQAPDVPRARVVHAWLAFASNEDGSCVEHAMAFLRQSEPGHHVDRARALELLSRAESRRGHGSEASAALAELNALADLIGTPSLLASVELARAAIAEPVDPEAARASLDDAVMLFERGRTPFEAAQARIELARVLDRLGRSRAAHEIRQQAQASLDVITHSAAERGPLTTRELEVLGLVAGGLTNPQIAQRLVVSKHTVHRHLANVMAKLEMGSRAAAVSRASELGVLRD